LLAGGQMIDFHLDTRSGVPPYLQLVQQVKQALRLGLLEPGDQLPTMREVVAQLAINPNTVLKAYRELDREGLVEARPGQGTLVSRALPPTPPGDYTRLQAALLAWLRQARAAGLDDDDVAALVAATLGAAAAEEAA
jgi:DNA-binding transcriptional regulator YhcF (GntR family)